MARAHDLKIRSRVPPIMLFDQEEKVGCESKRHYNV